MRLHEMRPARGTAAHNTSDLAELVCSNSLRSDEPYSAVGLLKREMEALGSILMRAAREHALPAGGALAVDRRGFSRFVTDALAALPEVTVCRDEVTEMPQGPCIIAAGPLASDAFVRALYRFLGDKALSFFDAIAPVVSAESLNTQAMFAQSRYDRGDGDDYLNIPLDQTQYENWIRELVTADVVPLNDVDQGRFFEACLPVEVMAQRGLDTLRFGPMKPVGLKDPRTGTTPHAVVQLRQDDFAGSLWNMVGFQTRLTWQEQIRIFRMLPGMEQARFVRLGTVHRNTFVNSPRHLLPTYQFRTRRDCFLAGQISGVEGYVESAASGLVAGTLMARFIHGKKLLPPPHDTALGALGQYIAYMGHRDFKPTNINFGIMPELPPIPKLPKKGRKRAYGLRAAKSLQSYATELGENLDLSPLAPYDL